MKINLVLTEKQFYSLFLYIKHEYTIKDISDIKIVMHRSFEELKKIKKVSKEEHKNNFNTSLF
jgi:hypothetical protein